jgi:hypothetical protein
MILKTTERVHCDLEILKPAIYWYIKSGGNA